MGRIAKDLKIFKSLTWLYCVSEIGDMHYVNWETLHKNSGWAIMPNGVQAFPL